MSLLRNIAVPMFAIPDWGLPEDALPTESDATLSLPLLKPLSGFQQIGRGRIKLTIAGTDHYVYDIDFIKVMDFDDVADAINDALTAAGLTVTVTYSANALTFEGGNLTAVGAGDDRANEDQHVYAYHTVSDVYAHPNTNGLHPDVYGGSWTSQLLSWRIQELIDLGVENFLHSRSAAERAVGDEYGIGYPPTNHSSLYASGPMGFAMLKAFVPEAAYGYVDAWEPLVSQMQKSIAYIGCPPLTRDKDSDWTRLVPSQDSQIVFVDFSGGNNTTGLVYSLADLKNVDPREADPSSVMAFKTLAAAYAHLRQGKPDWIVMRRGQTWTVGFPGFNVCGRGIREKIVQAAYGTGARPKIATATVSEAIYSHSAFTPGNITKHIAITDLHVDGGNDGSHRGIAFLGALEDILIEGCYAERYLSNIVLDADAGSTNVRVRRCVSVEPHTISGAAHCLYIGGVDGVLVEECVLEEDPLGAGTSILTTNTYIQSTCRNAHYRRNIAARAAATSTQVRCNGNIIENLFILNPFSLVAGGSSNRITRVYRNVVLGARQTGAQALGQGIQLVGVPAGTNAGWDMFENIISGAQGINSSDFTVIGISTESKVPNCLIRNNYVKGWRNSTDSGTGLLIGSVADASTITVRRNEFQDLPEVIGDDADKAQTYDHNKYDSDFPTTCFRHGSTSTNFAGWKLVRTDPDSAFATASYLDPDRTIETYLAVNSLPGDVDDFITAARVNQRKAIDGSDGWNIAYTARPVIDHVREGYGLDSVVAPMTWIQEAVDAGQSIAFDVLSAIDTSYPTPVPALVGVADAAQNSVDTVYGEPGSDLGYSGLDKWTDGSFGTYTDYSRARLIFEGQADAIYVGPVGKRLLSFPGMPVADVIALAPLWVRRGFEVLSVMYFGITTAQILYLLSLKGDTDLISEGFIHDGSPALPPSSGLNVPTYELLLT